MGNVHANNKLEEMGKSERPYISKFGSNTLKSCYDSKLYGEKCNIKIKYIKYKLKIDQEINDMPVYVMMQ